VPLTRESGRTPVREIGVVLGNVAVDFVGELVEDHPGHPGIEKQSAGESASSGRVAGSEDVSVSVASQRIPEVGSPFVRGGFRIGARFEKDQDLPSFAGGADRSLPAGTLVRDGGPPRRGIRILEGAP
jgi:hypothetical protein